MQFLKLNVENHVAVITMDAPPVNAVSAGLMDEMIAAFDQMSDRDDVRVVVLTGAGKIFCAGADIKSRANKTFEPGERWAHSRRARELSYSIIECKKPVIAAINGAALGAGLGIAVSCDILLCSENASLGLPEVDVGLMGGGRHAMRVCGHSLTRRMMLTGDRISGPELYRRGIVEVCVPLEELMPAAMEMAARIASKSPIASRTAKNSAATIENMTLRDGYRFEQNMTAELGQTEDSREAMRAFAEKRPPVFQGR
ncbi:enoyl-CoA hydratase [Acidovorax sp. Leaf76]|jgi:enoyl-CoA hydratase|uniref:enoyl-CoA hydratase/isomerase family protein n=1 Tax=unclassified Acidovorax TaxID=2684926 RepID=UPI0006F52F89|nr:MULTISPECIES: enoyl-CoA hydratase/isomerase family protein [unclassified Acidovorax]KQO24262.1 enoyl-CoA hydratase [Acidovorax sp. Leaf76]KQO37138.1 enoyl-CoA hydratase [Acidovorax sp. Leaf84]KQS29140.1 enoyl-CoA hydratase [Acidovorax sp. Leaf191]